MDFLDLNPQKLSPSPVIRRIAEKYVKEDYSQSSSQFALSEAIFGKNASYVLGHWTEIDSACSAYKVFEEEE